MAKMPRISTSPTRNSSPRRSLTRRAAVTMVSPMRIRPLMRGASSGSPRRIRRAAAALSAAPVIGRPMTRKSAPSAEASPGVMIRFWSPTSEPAGRMPGTTSLKSAPQSRFRTDDLPGRADDPVAALLLGEGREPAHLIQGRRLLADGGEIVIAEARHHRDPDQQRAILAGLARPLPPPGAASPARRRHGRSASSGPRRARCGWRPPRCSGCRGI